MVVKKQCDNYESLWNIYNLKQVDYRFPNRLKGAPEESNLLQNIWDNLEEEQEVGRQIRDL